MNLRPLILLVALSAFVIAPAQITKEKAAKSREILNKARQLDHLKYFLPMTLSKDQLNKLLSVIEKARANEDKVTLNEHNELVKIESTIDGEIDRGVKQGAVPSQEIMKKLSKLFSDFSIVRSVVAEENTDIILEAMKKIFRPDQLKIAQNTVNPKDYDPNLKPSTMTDDEKLRFFIKAVILDWTCYDVLLKLAARAS